MAEHETYYSAYWFSLDKTGVSEIDEILRLIAEAGKAYHSTEFWNDAYDESDEPSYIERIQEAANKAAAVLVAGREGR